MAYQSERLMSIIVTKSSPELVGPATTPATPRIGHISLSSFDKVLAFQPMTSVYIFDHAIHKPAETVRRALSQALVHYFPIAGRAAIGADGELRIACSGEGVVFVAASANRSLEDVKLFDPPFAPLLKELTVGYGPEGCRASDPLVLIQVTEFSCGGFVVGVTRNHVVADGKGIAQFMQAVGELARGLPQPSMLPVSCGDDSLPELPPVVVAIEKMMVELEPQSFVNLDITVPSRLINRVKAEFVSCSDEPCSVYEAAVAVLWQCRTRVVMSDPGAPATLLFAANVRKVVGAKYGYYGNCITSQVAAPTSGEVANADIKDVVKLIKRAKRRIPEQFMAVDDGEGGGHGMEGVSMEQLDVLLGYNALFVTSWRNLGHEAVDFGGGRPARVMCRLERVAVPYCVACLPCKNKDGANLSTLCVREEHVDALLGELAKFT
ncbi:hypothetical protein ACP70R_009221 [Stipagrostis hirtigluma subsp. patula]